LLIRELYLDHWLPLPRRDAHKPRQVLLISVDTLRESAISSLGGTEETPALDRLIARSQVWSPHYATSGWTKPSHGSLLTGYYPWYHGADSIEGALRPQVTTLAERFRQAGFATGALVYDCGWLDPDFGFARGFDEYRLVRWRLPKMIRQVSNWMAEHHDDSFFFFFHTFEVHSDKSVLPYEAPGVSRQTVAERFGVTDYGCLGTSCASVRLKKLKKGIAKPLPEEPEILRFLYSRGVSHTDLQLGLLFDNLTRLGIFDNMMIVLTSDHGEALLEHGTVLHGNSWEEILRVPLVWKWPGNRFAGERRDDLSSGVDVAPTLLAAQNISTEGLTGRNLLELPSERPVFARTHEWVVVSNGLKGIFSGTEPAHQRLYDLRQDPRETSDVSGQQPEVVAHLMSCLKNRVLADLDSLERLVEEAPRPADLALTEEQEARLKALGYLD
jgi:arylsulfatase A-like enzyme